MTRILSRVLPAPEGSARIFPDGKFRVRVKTRVQGLIWTVSRWDTDAMSCPAEDLSHTTPGKGSVIAIEKAISGMIADRGETLVERWLADKGNPNGGDPILSMMWKTDRSVYAAYIARTVV